MLIKYVLLFLIGLSGGFIVSGGVFAFITLLQLIPRLATRTGTAKYITLYEDYFIAGGIAGAFVSIFEWMLPIGYIGLGAIGVFSGIFVGCQALALAEVLNVIPVFANRIKLTVGIPFVVVSLAIGKALGAFYQLVVNR